MERLTNEQPKTSPLEGTTGPIPGYVMRDAIVNHSRVLKELRERRIEITDDSRSPEQILEAILRDEATSLH